MLSLRILGLVAHDGLCPQLLPLQNEASEMFFSRCDEASSRY